MPDNVAKTLAETLLSVFSEEVQVQFQGVVVIDANDIGCNVLESYFFTFGSVPPFEKIFTDNPFGQAREQTPIGIVVEKSG